jgi:SAM-dependent methyltransferase
MVPVEEDIAEHQRQIEENLRYWQAKPILREIYRDFHLILAGYLSAVSGETIEIGSGIGNIKEVIPNCVRTDIFSNPWIDRQENIYQLSMPSDSVANLILFDVFHHLEYPMDAVDECRRVLRKGGRLLVFDHAMSVAGFLFSKFVHHERAGFLKGYNLRVGNKSLLGVPRYYADHANTQRIFVRRFDELLRPDWDRVTLLKLPAIKWLLSGGYRGPSFVTSCPKPFINSSEKIGALAPFLSALRLVVVLQKT